jgi:hypothetical protein
LAGSEKLACHFSFHVLVPGAFRAWAGPESLRAGTGLVTVRAGAGLAKALKLGCELHALTAKTAAMTQVIFLIASLLRSACRVHGVIPPSSS